MRQQGSCPRSESQGAPQDDSTRHGRWREGTVFRRASPPQPVNAPRTDRSVERAASTGRTRRATNAYWGGLDTPNRFQCRSRMARTSSTKYKPSALALVFNCGLALVLWALLVPWLEMAWHALTTAPSLWAVIGLAAPIPVAAVNLYALRNFFSVDVKGDGIVVEPLGGALNPTPGGTVRFADVARLDYDARYDRLTISMRRGETFILPLTYLKRREDVLKLLWRQCTCRKTASGREAPGFYMRDERGFKHPITRYHRRSVRQMLGK